MAKPLSEQLSDLSDRAKKAEDAIASAHKRPMTRSWHAEINLVQPLKPRWIKSIKISGPPVIRLQRIGMR